MKRPMFWLLSAMALSLICSEVSQAQNLVFNNLSDDQANKVIDEISANFTHTTVSGASPLADVFGFQVGLVAGVSKSSEIDSLAKSIDPSAKADVLPHAGIIGLISVPLGFTFEASLVPKVGSDTFRFHNLGLAVKWSPTSAVLSLPVSLALRAHYMKSTLSFTQTVSSVTSTVDLEDKVMGLTALVSKNLGVIEPYAGLGLIKANGNFTVVGTSSFFSSGATSYSANRSSTQFLAGLEASLLILKLGLEYSHQFGVNGLTAKLAFGF